MVVEGGGNVSWEVWRRGGAHGVALELANPEVVTEVVKEALRRRGAR